ncbi:sulfite oxidase [Curtanaerobium respiraculi]|jgi:hypothetical protein|uniref:sulfite oxidase n=1 Tax=Curtanaerobium respiraculi TaxID=2949669 RepID=UPI0024B34063|nr:sulfite oxidase [Curtanaerobium respiraculi]
MIGEVQGKAKRPLTIRGYAQCFSDAIAAVQFSCDKGATWTTYETPQANDLCNVNWEFTFTPDEPGDYMLLVRALDSRGVFTPEAACVPFHVAAD